MVLHGASDFVGNLKRAVAKVLYTGCLHQLGRMGYWALGFGGLDFRAWVCADASPNFTTSF